MKKIYFTILASIVLSLASEVCNTGAFQIQAPIGSCINQGYICQLITQSTGGVQFFLGKNAMCSEFETTKFKTYPLKGENELDMLFPDSTLMPYLTENNDIDPQKNVSALAVAVNAAFIINAFNERYKVRVTYFQKTDKLDASSVRLQAIQKIP